MEKPAAGRKQGLAMCPISLLYHVDLVTLKLLLAISEEGTLTRASRREGIALSAASKRLVSLEKALGASLFLRNGQGMQLTNAGHTLLRHARQMLQGVQDIHQDLIRQLPANDRVRIIASPSAIGQSLAADLTDYMQAHGHVRIDLQACESEQLVDVMASGAADLAIFVSLDGTERLPGEPYRSDRLVLITAPDHPLASAGPIDFEQTLPYPHIGMHAYTSIYKRYETLHHDAPDMRGHVPDVKSLCRMVATNLGIGIMSGRLYEEVSEHFDLVAIPLEDEWSAYDLRIATLDSERLCPPAQALYSHLLRLQGMPPPTSLGHDRLAMAARP